MYCVFNYIIFKHFVHSVSKGIKIWKHRMRIMILVLFSVVFPPNLRIWCLRKEIGNSLQAHTLGIGLDGNIGNKEMLYKFYFQTILGHWPSYRYWKKMELQFLDFHSLLRFQELHHCSSPLHTRSVVHYVHPFHFWIREFSTQSWPFFQLKVYLNMVRHSTLRLF